MNHAPDLDGLINEENESYFNILMKRRRILGLKSVSLSFRVYKKIPAQHQILKLNNTKIAKMSLIMRGYLLGYPEFIDLLRDGFLICSTNDQECWKKEGIKQLDHLYDAKQFFTQWYNANLTKIISFRLFKYEKQLFYLKTWGYPPVAAMRFLYNANWNSIIWDKIDPFVLDQLTKGINFPDFMHSIDFNQDCESIYLLDD